MHDLLYADIRNTIQRVHKSRLCCVSNLNDGPDGCGLKSSKKTNTHCRRRDWCCCCADKGDSENLMDGWVRGLRPSQQYFSHIGTMEGWTWKALCNEAPFRFGQNLACSGIPTTDPLVRSRERCHADASVKIGDAQNWWWGCRQTNRSNKAIFIAQDDSMGQHTVSRKTRW